MNADPKARFVDFAPFGAHIWPDAPTDSLSVAKGITEEFLNDEYAVSRDDAAPANPIPAETGFLSILTKGSADPSCAEAKDAVVRQITAVIIIFFKLIICYRVSDFEYMKK